MLTLNATQQVIEDPELGIDYTRVVHGEQRFAYTRPHPRRRPADAIVSVDTIRSAGGHDMVTTRAESISTDGEPVVTARSTLVVRGPEGDA